MSQGLYRLLPTELAAQLKTEQPPLLLDVRRRAAFDRYPKRLPGGIPLLLDRDPIHIPDTDRTRPVVTYCLCRGEASSLRAARWLRQSGYERVAVLAGGLPAWQLAGCPVQDIDLAAGSGLAWRELDGTRGGCGVDEHSALIPLIAEQTLLTATGLPVRREMAVLFVDMVDSTRLVLGESPERALALVQTFMAKVVEVALHHCGDVHDFAGDGALLYFAGAGEAVPAAFALRERLARMRDDEPRLPEARFAIASGPLLIGRIGGTHRQGLSFLGPCVNIAAGSLELVPAEGIVVTDDVYREIEITEPDLAAEFNAMPVARTPKGLADRMPSLLLS